MELSDKALSVFAFAAYHQLESGQTVSRVVRRDGAGHEADPGAVAELQEKGLVRASEDDIVFEPAGARLVEAAVEGIRRAASGAAG